MVLGYGTLAYTQNTRMRMPQKILKQENNNLAHYMNMTGEIK